MNFLKKALSSVFLFILSFGLPKLFVEIFYPSDKNSPLLAGGAEEILTDLLTLFIWLFLARVCLWFLDSKSTDKKLFSMAIPNQTNQLTPIISGIIVGVFNTIRYYGN